MRNILMFSCLLLASCHVPTQHFSSDHPFYEIANPQFSSEQEALIKNQMEKHQVKVAVLDAGVDYLHPEIFSNIRFNRSGVGIGLDITGRDFFPYFALIDNDSGGDFSKIFEVYEHGTHVSSLAVLGGFVSLPNAQRSNAKDLIGLIPVRVIPFSLDDFGEGISLDKIGEEKEFVHILIQNITKAIDFAHQEGAFVVNMSLGAELTNLSDEAKSYYYDLIKKEFNKKLTQTWQDMLFIIAAGNESVNIDESIIFPASVAFVNQLVIGATEMSGKNEVPAEYTNIGSTVDVSIRGTDIKALFPHNEREKLSGTSMAAPLVSNLALKIKLTAPCLNAAEVRKIILETAGAEKLVSFKKGLQLAQSYCR
jgi:subtilisin family serine protease